MADPALIDMSTLAGGAAGIGGLVGAWLYVRRQLSADKTAMEEDRVARDQLKRLEAENVRLSERLEIVTKSGVQRPEDAVLIASLEAERNLLLRDIKRAVRRLPPEVVDALETDFAKLADVDERIEPRGHK